MSEQVSVITKVKNTIGPTDFISDLKSKEIVGASCKKELKITNQKEFRIEKVTRRKSDKLNFEWNSYGKYLILALIKRILLYENELFFN